MPRTRVGAEFRFEARTPATILLSGGLLLLILWFLFDSSQAVLGSSNSATAVLALGPQMEGWAAALLGLGILVVILPSILGRRRRG